MTWEGGNREHWVPGGLWVSPPPSSATSDGPTALGAPATGPTDWESGGIEVRSSSFPPSSHGMERNEGEAHSPWN